MNNSLCYLAGLLGALGGADNSNKAFRRWGIPIIYVIMGYLMSKNYWSGGLLLISFTLYLGYGIPSPRDKKPSKLAGYFYRFFPYSLEEEDWEAPSVKKRRILVGLCTRATIQSLKALIVGIWAISVGFWGIVAWYIPLFIVLTTIIPTLIDPKGTFKCFGRELLYSEFLLYLVETYLFTLFIGR